MRALIATAGLSVLSACSSYTYYARSPRTDSLGETREVLAYWRVTRRALWFDESSESVEVKLQCSLRTMDFEEQPQGIVFRSDGTWIGARDEGGQSICGRVHGVKRVKDVKEGQSITFELWCTAAQGDFAAPTSFLPPGTYQLTNVARQKKDVDVPNCTTSATP